MADPVKGIRFAKSYLTAANAGALALYSRCVLIFASLMASQWDRFRRSNA